MPQPPALPPALPDLQLLLRGVSRSFYLSIRLLPAGLRRPVALAYLLARAADSIADAGTLPSGERAVHLDRLSAAVQDGSRQAEDAAGWSAVLGPGDDPQARLLLQRLPQGLAWLQAVAPEERTC